MVERPTWRIAQQVIGVVIIAVSLAKFVDNTTRPANELLYRVRSSYVERWQEQVGFLFAMAGTTCMLVIISRSGGMRR